ncbi:MAG: extracellular solute-binding protein [Chloroflexi bacterium]|nr:extracellular solute-binding protein [Chloroflexota bacterium]
MNNAQVIIVLSGILLVLGACGPGPAARDVAPAPKAVVTAGTKLAWEEDWERTLVAARKEGEVSVFVSTGGEWLRELGAAMSQRYGITLETGTAKVAELGERIVREQRSKVHYVDIVIDGRVVSGLLQSEGLLESLEKLLVLPEVADPKAWWRGQPDWLVAPEAKTVLGHIASVSAGLLVNTDLVKFQEIRTWNDLLDPKWKGKMVINDPTTAGSGQSLMTMLAYKIMDWDYLNRLVRQEPVPLRDNRLMVEWVARGRNPVLIGPPKGPSLEFMQAGAPLALHSPLPGGYLSVSGGHISLLKTSPHPNAAKILINYFLTREGQTAFSKSSGYQSSRADVPTDHLLPALARQPGIEYPSVSEKGYVEQEAELTNRVAKLFQAITK